MGKAVQVDAWLLVPVLLLLAAGLVMVGSSSIAVAESNGVSASFYLVRHVIYIVLGLLLALFFRGIPVSLLEKISQPLIWVSALLLPWV